MAISPVYITTHAQLNRVHMPLIELLKTWPWAVSRVRFHKKQSILWYRPFVKVFGCNTCGFLMFITQ